MRPSSPLALRLDARRTALSEDTTVRRVLPHAQRRMVGPFIFFDHFGPGTIQPGAQADVRPHPHIGLATVTYLFDGRSMHRDSLGVVQSVEPGSINLMKAGRGIVHSERVPDDLTDVAHPSHGLQLWLALPADQEDDDPAFQHHPAEVLPSCSPADGVAARVLIGEAFGHRSPVEPYSPTLYVTLDLDDGASVDVPMAAQRAVYVVAGVVTVGDDRLEEGQMGVLEDGAEAGITAQGSARAVVVGGDRLDGPRHIWWNLVASTAERIEAAAARWADRGFDAIPDDDDAFIPLPEPGFRADRSKARW